MITTTQFTLETLDKEKIFNDQLVFVYGSRTSLSESKYFNSVRACYPDAQIISLSTSGHYLNNTVVDDDVVIQGMNFQKTKIVCKSLNASDYYMASYDLGVELMDLFDQKDLKAVGLIADGSIINGSEFIAGVNKSLGNSIIVFGGMAGDGLQFEQTLTGLNSTASKGEVIAFGIYGNAININVFTDKSWMPFGLEYKITKSDRNLLYELDGKNAYDVLKNLLQPKNQEHFTQNTLYFPFQLSQKGKPNLVRTPLFLDHENKVITYAGDMPEGATVKIMKAGTVKLLDSVASLGEEVIESEKSPDVVMMVSCVGRRVVLNKLVSEEGFEISESMPETTSVHGFYSYGEFSQFKKEEKECHLHNQTLTLTTFTEK